MGTHGGAFFVPQATVPLLISLVVESAELLFDPQEERAAHARTTTTPRRTLDVFSIRLPQSI
jgi:hypothetical protein